MRDVLKMRHIALKCIIIIFFISLTIGCINTDENPVNDHSTSEITEKSPEPVSSTPTTSDTPLKPDVTTTPTPKAIDTTLNKTIKIASFNIQVFGKTKASKQDVVNVLSKIIRNFDIVAIQEIRDISQTSLPALKDAVNSNGESVYDFVVGERLGRTSSKEQYAYLYNTQTIELTGQPTTFQEPPDNDMFHREPYLANFKVMEGNFDFVLITVHTDPDEAIKEINALPDVVEQAKEVYHGEADYIILGDLNADCNYFNENSPSPLKSSEYFWVINNSVDTTTKSTVCTYDRIILTAPAITDFTGGAGIFSFDTEYNLNDKETTAVSDHYPVYAEFWSDRDDD
ncbi:MAG: hypothetical protein CVV34_00085 [Methanomicrobiales archaeon HGW-Methanomicrobiales-5]|jgi:endonuclease/exonuclease/phosphatase family metal-dependent hydrolase|nr:MAG: hypothetical protein CVV34_00085 [Methanomicrobiales archaeon HGW-Methanomicrobiales-5]